MTENGLAPDKASPSRWPHRWAVLTACATVGLLLIGARVTTLRVGMADTEWPTHPLHLFFSSRNDSGYLIEHSHRLGGYVVGCFVQLVFALLVSLALFTSRWWQAETAPAREQDRPRLLRLALLLSVVIFV